MHLELFKVKITAVNNPHGHQTIFITYSDVYPTRCNVTQFIYFCKTALLVSGGISTHHQEHTQLYLQHLVLVNLLPLPGDGWRYHPKHVQQFSRNK